MPKLVPLERENVGVIFPDYPTTWRFLRDTYCSMDDDEIDRCMQAAMRRGSTNRVNILTPGYAGMYYCWGYHVPTGTFWMRTFGHWSSSEEDGIIRKRAGLEAAFEAGVSILPADKGRRAIVFKLAGLAELLQLILGMDAPPNAKDLLCAMRGLKYSNSAHEFCTVEPLAVHKGYSAWLLCRSAIHATTHPGQVRVDARADLVALRTNPTFSEVEARIIVADNLGGMIFSPLQYFGFLERIRSGIAAMRTVPAA